MPSKDESHRSHLCKARCHWSGSTGAGCRNYDSAHTASVLPTSLPIELSADPALRGESSSLNPEQLVVLAVTSCQLLSFLAVAARARVDVLGYDDESEGVMREDDLPMRLTSISLRPTIRVASGTSEDRVKHLVEVAHRECYVANSIRVEVTIDPTVIVEPCAGLR
jgi:organic hydroperoxide reductase OsmC/OhrA